MKKRAVYLLAVIWFICPVLSLGNGEIDLCANTDQPLACLKANFEKLYSASYPRFWRILRQGAAQAERCDAVVKTTAFLELSVFGTNNAEFNEFLSEVIERLATEKTDCFLAATSKADAVAQERIIERLRHPLYVDVAVIDHALKRRIDGDYRPLINLYFQERR